MQQIAKRSFINSDYYLSNDNIEPGYEEASEAVVCVASFIEDLQTSTITTIIDRKINKQIPESIMAMSYEMFNSALEQLDIGCESEPNFFCDVPPPSLPGSAKEIQKPSKEKNFSSEPENIGIDTWARRRVTKHDNARDSDGRPIQCFGEQDATIFQEAQRRFQKAKESVKTYLQQNINEDQLPQPIELKQIVEMASIEEQSLRALKEQQSLKNEQKKNEEKRRLENMRREKKGTANLKGVITYDFEGNIINIKPPNANKLGGVNFQVGVNIPQQINKEDNDPSLVQIPRAKNIDDPFKLPSLINKKNDTVNKKIDISEKNPFDSIELTAGVKFRHGNKEKANPMATTSIKTETVYRMTKDDYLKLVEEKGQQNRMMSRKAQDNMLSVVKDADKEATTVEMSQDMHSSMKTQAFQRFDKTEKASKQLKKNAINVKNSMRIAELVVKEDFDFGIPSYKQKLGQKLAEKKQNVESNKLLPTSGGMSDMDEFNLQLLKNGGEVPYEPGQNKNLGNMKLRPIKSDSQQIAKSLGDNTKYPRDRTYAARNQNKFESLKNMLNKDTDRNIFKKVH